MFEYLEQDLGFAKKSCTVYLSSIILVEIEFFYKRFEKRNLLHLPLPNFQFDLVI